MMGVPAVYIFFALVKRTMKRWEDIQNYNISWLVFFACSELLLAGIIMPTGTWLNYTSTGSSVMEQFPRIIQAICQLKGLEA